MCNGCLSGAPKALVECALDGIGTHEDYLVPVGVGFALCTEPYTVRIHLPIPCRSPFVDASDNYMPGAMFQFVIGETNEERVCALRITSPTQGAPFNTIPHLLVSVDSPNPTFSRVQFVIGIEGSTVPTCPGNDLAVMTNLDSCK
jgi:hypothetical protein